MRNLLLTAGVLAMSIATASVAKPGGNGGGGGGNPRAERSQGGGGGGGGQHGRGGDHARGGGGEARQHGNGGGDHAQRGQQRQERRAERSVRQEQRAQRHEDRGPGRVERIERRAEDRGQRRVERIERIERRAESRGASPERVDREVRRAERRAVMIRDASQVQRLRHGQGVGLVNGCPPGLARRNNGCMPPGQLRQQQRAWSNNLWNVPGTNAGNFVYDDGYLYQLAPTGAVSGFVPLLGGALWPGQTWPNQFAAAPVPDYYTDYFGAQQPYDYRLADGVIYGVDPQTSAIQQVLALVTGDDWSIGQRMPDGYGVYNVPYEYRDQYFDTADSMYRYDDGYVYQIDPTTQLIQAAIQLIT